MNPQSAQPYALHSAWRRTRARSADVGAPKYASTYAAVCSTVKSHSVEVLPSSKHGSLLPEYS